MKENTNVFKYAVENKLRFPFKGNLTVEDLFDLSVKDLKTIYKTLNAKKKKFEEENEDYDDSIFGTSSIDTKEYNDLCISIEILKEIAVDKKEESEKNKKEAENKMLKEKYLEILSRKENAELESLSIDELKEKINNL